MSEPHRYRSPLLGAPRRVPTRAGEVELFERGAGPPLAFAHGWLANANLWRGVIDRLAGRATAASSSTCRWGQLQLHP